MLVVAHGAIQFVGALGDADLQAFGRFQLQLQVLFAQQLETIGEAKREQNHLDAGTEPDAVFGEKVFGSSPNETQA